jgi:hypothetical protein
MRHLSTLFAFFACVLAVGCPLAQDPVEPVAPNLDSAEPLRELVSRTLDENLRDRELSTETHGAWQILHGVLAYGDQFTIETPGGQRSAVEYLLNGNTVNGFEPTTGDLMDDTSRPGLRIDMQPGTKTGQGHRDQWLAVLAQCGLPLQTKLRSGDHSFTIDDWLRQTEYDVPRNLELEFSWTLIALTAYRDTDHRWTARDGVQYSTTQLLDSELRQSIPSSVCGGTHRLIGIAMSLKKRRDEGKPINGVWADAESLLAESVASAKMNQNPDGSYSVAYLHRPGWTRDLGESLGTTGHVLEFLAFAAADETLRQPWVERSVRRLCGMLFECKEVDLECGVLYHALHGLSEFRNRMDKINADS